MISLIIKVITHKQNMAQTKKLLKMREFPLSTEISGDTYDYRSFFKFFGGQWDNDSKSWKFAKEDMSFRRLKYLVKALTYNYIITPLLDAESNKKALDTKTRLQTLYQEKGWYFVYPSDGCCYGCQANIFLALADKDITQEEASCPACGYDYLR